MKPLIFFVYLFFMSTLIFAQNLAPKNILNRITIIENDRTKEYKNYYLTSMGKIVGRDSLFLVDNSPDCENEGFIRFHDPITEKVGIFNRNGYVVIPAEYNSLSKVINGMVIGLKNATKDYGDNKKHLGCNHFIWKGGEYVLIDTNNRLLVENFNNAYHLNLFSLMISTEINDGKTRENFKGKNGKYFSFVNNDKEFEAWLKDSLLNNLSKDNILNHSCDSIYYDNSEYRSISTKNDFLNKYLNTLIVQLELIKTKQTSYHIFDDELVIVDRTDSVFKSYFDECLEYKYWKYPVKNIVISNEVKGRLEQAHIEFVRTGVGYKLINVSIN